MNPYIFLPHIFRNALRRILDRKNTLESRLDTTHAFLVRIDDTQFYASACLAACALRKLVSSLRRVNKASNLVRAMTTIRTGPRFFTLVKLRLLIASPSSAITCVWSVFFSPPRIHINFFLYNNHDFIAIFQLDWNKYWNWSVIHKKTPNIF